MRNTFKVFLLSGAILLSLSFILFAKPVSALTSSSPGGDSSETISGDSDIPTDSDNSSGKNILVNSTLNVRDNPSVNANLLGAQVKGATGVIIDGPVIANNFIWWKVNYASGVDGWSVENYMVPAGSNLNDGNNNLYFNAIPSTITSGQASTIVFSPVGATFCSSSSFSTPTGGGTFTVSPTTTTTYSISCTGWGAFPITKTTTVTVTPTTNNQTNTVAFSPSTLTAKPGSSFTLNYTITGAFSTCGISGVGLSTYNPTHNTGANSITGTTSVASTTPYTYNIDCYNNGIPTRATAYVTSSTSDTTNNPVSTKFVVGDKVKTTDTLNVHSIPSNSSSSISADARQAGAKGTVIDGPTTGDGYVWWKVSYTNGPTGWSAEASSDGTKEYLVKDTTTSNPSTNTVVIQAGVDGSTFSHYTSSSPLVLTYQQSLWIKWTASQDGPLTCSLNAPNGGTVQRSGTLNYAYNQNILPKVTTTYTITCGNATDSVTVVPPGAPAPINVSFKINGKHGTAADPVIVPVGQDMQFTWTADPVATNCQIEPQPGGLAGNSGSYTMKNNSVPYPYFEQFMSRTYRVTCTDGGSKKGTDMVTVVPSTAIAVNSSPTTVDLQASLDHGKTWKDAPVNAPLIADADQKLLMRWKTTNTRACSFGEPLTHYNNNVWPWPKEFYQINPTWDTNPTNNLLGYIQWWANDPMSYPPRGSTVTYTLTCDGGILPDGTDSVGASDSITIKNDPPAVSKVELKVNDSNGSTPTSAGMTAVTFKYGDPVKLSWNIVGGADCYFFRDSLTNDLSSFLTQGNSSSKILNPGDLGYPPNGGSYTLSCTVAAGTGASDLGPGYDPRIIKSAWIVVTDPSVPTPSVTLRLNGQANNITVPSGQNLSLTWASDNVDSCDLYLGNTFEATEKNVGVQSTNSYVIKPGESNYPTSSKYTNYSIRCKYSSGGGGESQGFAQAILGSAVSNPLATGGTGDGTNPGNGGGSGGDKGNGTVPGSGTGDGSNTGCLELRTTLQLNSSGADVITLQQFLISKGYLSVPSGVDLGYFGPLTKSAVIAFQKANGTSADGVVGPLTRGKIQVLTCTDGSNTGGSGSSNPSTGSGSDSNNNTSSAVQLKANGTSGSVNVSLGSAVALSWATTGQSSCYKSSTPASEFTGVLLPVASGSVTVYPTSAIQYKITCGSLTSSVSVNGGSGESAGGSGGSNIISNAFNIGDTVSATSLLNVRQEPILTSAIVSAVSSNTQGTVTSGPSTGSGYTWWKVNFAGGVSGWSVGSYLVKVTAQSTNGNQNTNNTSNASNTPTPVFDPNNPDDIKIAALNNPGASLLSFVKVPQIGTGEYGFAPKENGNCATSELEVVTERGIKICRFKVVVSNDPPLPTHKDVTNLLSTSSANYFAGYEYGYDVWPVLQFNAQAPGCTTIDRGDFGRAVARGLVQNTSADYLNFRTWACSGAVYFGSYGYLQISRLVALRTGEDVYGKFYRWHLALPVSSVVANTGDANLSLYQGTAGSGTLDTSGVKGGAWISYSSLSAGTNVNVSVTLQPTHQADMCILTPVDPDTTLAQMDADPSQVQILGSSVSLTKNGQTFTGSVVVPQANGKTQARWVIRCEGGGGTNPPDWSYVNVGSLVTQY